MGISATASQDGAEIRIRISDRFDFNLHRDFRSAYERHGGSGARYVLDLSDTSYLDSSALGMLLQLREHAGGSKDAVNIVNASPGIREILQIANFDRLLTIR